MDHSESIPPPLTLPVAIVDKILQSGHLSTRDLLACLSISKLHIGTVKSELYRSVEVICVLNRTCDWEWEKWQYSASSFQLICTLEGDTGSRQLVHSLQFSITSDYKSTSGVLTTLAGAVKTFRNLVPTSCSLSFPPSGQWPKSELETWAVPEGFRLYSKLSSLTLHTCSAMILTTLSTSLNLRRLTLYDVPDEVSVKSWGLLARNLVTLELRRYSRNANPILSVPLTALNTLCVTLKHLPSLKSRQLPNVTRLTLVTDGGSSKCKRLKESASFWGELEKMEKLTQISIDGPRPPTSVQFALFGKDKGFMRGRIPSLIRINFCRWVPLDCLCASLRDGTGRVLIKEIGVHENKVSEIEVTLVAFLCELEGIRLVYLQDDALSALRCRSFLGIPLFPLIALNSVTVKEVSE